MADERARRSDDERAGSHPAAGSLFLRRLAFYRPGRHGPGLVTPLPDEPSPAGGLHRLRGPYAVALAIALPAVTCLALVPVREGVDRSTAALVLVLPVVAVALASGPVPAGLAAATAAVAFDVLLTRPYYWVEIHAAEDVEATAILLVVGVIVGQLVARTRSSQTKAVARARELEALVAVIGLANRPGSVDELVEGGSAVLADLLDLRECRWAPGYHGAAGPVLTRTGEITDEWKPSADHAHLPASGAELPVTHRGRELGRMILMPARQRPISREERATAVAISDLLGRALDEQERA